MRLLILKVFFTSNVVVKDFYTKNAYILTDIYSNCTCIVDIVTKNANIKKIYIVVAF